MKNSKLITLFIVLSFVLVFSGIAQQKTEETVACAVGGEVMKKAEAKTTYEYKGKTYYFCGEGCKEKFVKDPEKYLQQQAQAKDVYTCPMHPEVKSDKPGKCSKCGMNLEKKPMTHEHGQKAARHETKQEAKHGEKCGHEQEKACCPMAGMMKSCGVEISVENLNDGVAVKLTSKDADTVKKIQEHAAKIKSMTKEGEKTCEKECCKKK